MTQVIAPTPDDGYGWRMSDSDRLNTRLETEVAKRVARRNPPRPFSAAAAETQIAQHLSTKKLDMSQVDRLLAEAEERAWAEWNANRAALRTARLPALYRDADFPRTEWGLEAKRWVDAYRAGSRKGLCILGNVGTGKTWVSAAIAVALMVHDKPVPTTLITVPDLFGALRQGIAHEVGVDLAQFITAPVLILDDLGQEMQTPFTTEQLFRLAHARSHNALPTIVTSNLTGDAIKERYESRTVQRLFGGSGLISIPGESRRDLPF